MKTRSSQCATPLWAIAITLLLPIGFGGVFILAFVSSGLNSAPTPAGLTADSYMDEVKRLLAGADPERGKILVTEVYECHVCHIRGAGKVAPDFVGLAQRAGKEHPPLQAAAYIYESLLNPAAHIVEGYSGAMPLNYVSRLKENELGDIIAFLLTQ